MLGFTSAFGQVRRKDTTAMPGLDGTSGVLLGPKEIFDSEFKLLNLIRHCEELKCIKSQVADLGKKTLKYLDSADITLRDGRMSVKIYAQNNEYLSKNTYDFSPRDRGPFLFNINTQRALKKVILPISIFNARKFKNEMTFKDNVQGYKKPTARIIFKQLID